MISDGAIPEIEVWTSHVDVESVRKAVKSLCPEGFCGKPMPSNLPRFRSAESVQVLIGTVTCFSVPVFSEFVKGLFALARERRSRRIVLRDGDTMLELPVGGLSGEDVDNALSLFERIKGAKRPSVIV